MLLVAGSARAEPRPTEGGLWSFSPRDVVQSWDEERGHIRVHYSVEGPNATSLLDDDGDGVPDFAQLAARTTAEAAALYEGELGFRPPVAELEVGEALGGSEALDLYLVDFDGAADGRFGVDGCTADGRCAGFLVVENDFSGYGYASAAQGIRVVTSHELFHAVQAAYIELPIWMSEGGAVWATHRFDDALPDFIAQTAGFLADPTRPLDQPPPGPVPAFAYGTALWFDFVARRDGASVLEAMLTDAADAGEASAEVMASTLAAADDELAYAWPDFVRANLAAGFRAGVATSHPYAAELVAIDATHEGSDLDFTARVWPLAAAYWRVDHGGGVLVFGADEAMPRTQLSLHPIAAMAADGVVGDAIEAWDVSVAGSIEIAELPPAGYWIVATVAEIGDAPDKARVCVGSPAHVQACGIEPRDDAGDESGDTGGADESDTGDPSATGDETGDSSSETGGSGDDGGAVESAESGCACRHQRGRASDPLLLTPLLLAARRRRPRGR